MWVTNLFLVAMLFLTFLCFYRSSPSEEMDNRFAWGGMPVVWHNNLSPPYSVAQPDAYHVFNPAAYRK